MLEVGNTSRVALTADSVIPFTTVFYNTNNRTTFNSNTNSMVITKAGMYKVGGTFIFTPTSAGVVSISMYVNGQQEPTAISTFTATAGDSYTFTIPSKYIRGVRASQGQTIPITFVVDADGTLTNANAFVYYLPKVNE